MHQASCGSTASQSTDLNRLAPSATRRGVAVVGGIASSPTGPAAGAVLAEGVACDPDTTILTRDQGRARGYPDIQPNNRGVLRRETVPLNRFTPGYGSSHPSCQDVRFQVVCPEDINHYHRLARYNCHRPECPECWTGWAARAAADAAARIEGYQTALGGATRSPRHVTFSPQPGSVETLDDLYGKCNSALRKVSIQAAAIIAHPYRLKNGGRERVPMRSWGNRYTEVLVNPTWRDHVIFSPHIHALIYGPLPDPETFKKLTEGWIYVNHDEDSRGRSGDELRGTLYYLLTHAWVRGNNAVVRYWFGMSTRTLRKIPGETYKETVPCPVCATPCKVIPPDIETEGGQPKPFYQDIRNAPVHLKKIKTWEFIIWSDRKLPSNFQVHLGNNSSMGYPGSCSPHKATEGVL